MNTALAPPRASSPGHPHASCASCARTFSRPAFELLPFQGSETVNADLFELRRCPCARIARASKGPAGGWELS